MHRDNITFKEEFVAALKLMSAKLNDFSGPFYC